MAVDPSASLPGPTAVPTHPGPAGDATAESGGFALFGDDGLTFWDLLDVINPLQHIPLVNVAYREITGDDISPGARLAGGGLFGGIIGLVASAVSVAVEAATGKDPADHVMVAMGIKDDVPEGGATAVASAASAGGPMAARLPEVIPVETEAPVQFASLPKTLPMPDRAATVMAGEALGAQLVRAAIRQTTDGESPADPRRSAQPLLQQARGPLLTKPAGPILPLPSKGPDPATVQRILELHGLDPTTRHPMLQPASYPMAVGAGRYQAAGQLAPAPTDLLPGS